MWRIIICDDEDDPRREVEHALTQAMQQLHIKEHEYKITLFSSLAQLQRLIPEPDILLLDIAFQERDSGVRAAMQLRGRWNRVQIIFVTSMGTEFYQNAFHANAAGYVEKQMLKKDLPGALQDAIRNLRQLPPPSPKLLFRVEIEPRLIEPKFITADNILYIESQGHKLFLHMCKPFQGKTVLRCTGTLKREAARLSEFLLLRVYKSFIANMYNVTAMDDGIMHFANGDEILYDIDRDTELRLLWEGIRVDDLQER